MQNSKIEWTDHTANFWWGCFKVSPGCQHCYAETLAHRYQKNIWGPVSTTDRELKVGIWKELPKWNAKAKSDGVRRRVFVQSMSDFFEAHPQVLNVRQRALELMLKCDWLDFQVLTKRPENILRMTPKWFQNDWPENVWPGTSVENQEMADLRIPELLKIPAKVRFLSMEPLLGPVDLFDIAAGIYELDCLRGKYGEHARPQADCAKVDWVIVGGESGPKRRLFNPAWARAIRDQCVAVGVPFFMKQWDKVQPIPDDLMIREFPGVK
jgi:protein gp37